MSNCIQLSGDFWMDKNTVYADIFLNFWQPHPHCRRNDLNQYLCINQQQRCCYIGAELYKARGMHPVYTVITSHFAEPYKYVVNPQSQLSIVQRLELNG